MHLHATLTGDGTLDHLTRVIARLHSARIEPAELRMAGNALCVELTNAAGATRAAELLTRLVGVTSVSVSWRCDTQVAKAPAVRTTYVPYVRPRERKLVETT